VTVKRDDFILKRRSATSNLPVFICKLGDDSSYTHDAAA